MDVEITSRVLPGIGVCQEIGLCDGRRVGVVNRRDGLRDLVLYDDEGDGALGAVSLDADEAGAVAELLRGSVPGADVVGLSAGPPGRG